MPVKDMLLEIVDVRKETESVKTFRFRPDKPMDFNPGQFVQLTREIDGEKVTRSYSVSSSPSRREYFEITFKVYPEGKFSPVLWKMGKGDTIKASGPMGMFCFDECRCKNLVFIAGGTGIAAFSGMVRHTVEDGLDYNITLIYSARNPGCIIFRDEFFSLAEKSDKFRFVVTITRPWTSEEKWDGRTGRMDAEFLEETIKGDMNRDSMFYLCGPPKMVESVHGMLEKIGVKEERIKSERWG